MKYEIYEDIKVNDDLSIYDFISTGPKGAVHKRIVFERTEMSGVYNLAFGDVVPDQIEINEYSISNNGDRNKILATIAVIVDCYTQKYPERWVYFQGSTVERTRLYRMAIGINLEELSAKFDVYSQVGNEILPFSKTVDATAFLVKRKR